MFIKNQTTKYTKNYWEQIKEVTQLINNADSIIIGAGSGLSTAAGFTYSGKKFQDYFSDFIDVYGFHDMYSAGFYPYASLEEYWAYWSRHIYYNRYDQPAGEPYLELLELVKDKEYFVITTNVDHRFQVADFDKERLYYTQGDYGLFQCSKACHQKTYDNEKEIRQMIKLQKNMRIPSELIPHCPVCGAPMTTNLRIDDTFVQDQGWHQAKKNYEKFLTQYTNKKVLYLDLGVGNNTPGIIKYPFWRMTYENNKSNYVSINLEPMPIVKEIEEQSIGLVYDIKKVITDLKIERDCNRKSEI